MECLSHTFFSFLFSLHRFFQRWTYCSHLIWTSSRKCILFQQKKNFKMNKRQKTRTKLAWSHWLLWTSNFRSKNGEKRQQKNFSVRSRFTNPIPPWWLIYALIYYLLFDSYWISQKSKSAESDVAKMVKREFMIDKKSRKSRIHVSLCIIWIFNICYQSVAFNLCSQLFLLNTSEDFNWNANFYLTFSLSLPLFAYLSI